MSRPTLQCTECGAPVRGSAGLGLCAACALRGAINVAGGADAEGKPRGPMAHGDYELLDEVARGGMGIVYRARQRSLHRIVALKVLLGGAFAGEEGKRRLRAEANAVAKLQHPNIVAIHEAGELDGQPFYAMEFIKGRTLAEIVRSGALPANRAAKYVVRIAEAVHYAHGQGVLHRDLKPSNVIVDAHDEPRVTDFGLAKMFDSTPGGSSSANPSAIESLTLTGQVLGSPAYMPPEQAGGRSREISPASDVYSIGAILYELLTARPPFQGDTPHTVIEQVKHAEPVPVRRLNGSVSADLETICLKCLEKEPSRRYPTARALADDAQRFLEHQPIRARPVGVVGKTWRWSLRNRGAAAAIVTFVVALIAIAMIASITSVRVSRAQAATEKARRQATQRLAESLISEAHTLRDSGLAGFREAGLQRLREALTLDKERLRDRIRGEAIAVLVRPDVRRVVITNVLPGIDAMHGCFDARFERCVNATREGRGIYRVSDGSLLQVIPKRGKIPDEVVSFSPDGRFILLRFGRATQLIEADTANIVLATNLPGGPAAFGADGRLFARVEGQRVAVYELDGVMTNGLAAAQSWAIGANRRWNGMVFDFTGERLAMTDHSGLVSVREASSGQIKWEQKIAGAAWKLDWSANGEWLAVVADRDRLFILNSDTGTLHRQINTPTDPTTSIAFSPLGDQFACAGSQTGVRFFDSRSGRLLIADNLGSWHLRFDSSGQRLGTFLQRGQPAWIEMLPPTGVLPLSGAHFSDEDPNLNFSSDGEWLWAKTINGARTWNVRTGRDARVTPISAAVFLTAGAHTNELLISRKTTLVSRAVDSDRESPLLSGGVWFWGHARTDDGRYIAVADHSAGNVTVIDRAQQNATQARFSIPAPERVAFSPDGRWLVAGAFYDGFVYVWDWQKSAVPVVTLRPAGHLLSFSRDGQWLMTFGRGLRLWRTTDWQPVSDVPITSNSSIQAASLSPDKRWLAMAQNQREVHLIDLMARRTVAVFEPAGEGAIRNLLFHPDGKRLALSRGHDEVQLWDLPVLLAELAKLGLDW